MAEEPLRQGCVPRFSFRAKISGEWREHCGSLKAHQLVLTMNGNVPRQWCEDMHELQGMRLGRTPSSCSPKLNLPEMACSSLIERS